MYPLISRAFLVYFALSARPVHLNSGRMSGILGKIPPGKERKMATIYEIYGSDAHAMTMALMEAAHIADRIPRGGSVALKPNLVTASRPEEGATTHAGVLSGCMEYLQAHGFTRISVIEGSWVGGDTAQAFRTAGYDQVCREYGVPYYDLKRDKTRTVQTALRPMEICCRALDTDFLINLPVLKGHCQTAMTCALKNCKGCLPDREKRRFHAEGLHRPIAALAARLRPQVTIVDSICGDLNFEEGGTPVHTNRMYLGSDPVQVDAYSCKLMGLRLSQVPYISLAQEMGGGSAAIRDSDLVKLNEPEAGTAYLTPSGAVAALTRGVHQDSACSACYASLVRALYRAKQEGCRVRQPIYIGQAFRGRSLDGIGIGACCSGAACPVKGCPPTADAILEALQAQPQDGPSRPAGRQK